MTKEEVEKRIDEIASIVYEIDPDEPDPSEFALKDDIRQLLDDLGVIYEESTK